MRKPKRFKEDHRKLSICLSVILLATTTSSNSRLYRRLNPTLMAAVAEGVDKFDGYTDFRGAEASRAAVAEYFSKLDGVAISKDDVYLTLGGSLGIYLCIAVLCNPGDNFLMPEAGFPLANTIAKSLGVEVKFYKLNRSNKWQAEIDSMRK